MTNEQEPRWKTLTAGAVAGLIVDTSLYPLDTIKSRLQSKQGFTKAGGCSHLYRGLPPVLAGSVPNAALFFLTYETMKNKLNSHIIAASFAEFISASVRVPYEVVKTRSQTSVKSNITILREILFKEGLAGLYRGFNSTIIRDVPFSAIQYPIWELLKTKDCTAAESAFYGSIAGGIAAFVTTPLDVIKTRIMLAERDDILASGKVVGAFKVLYREKGVRGLFAGVIPRVIWISIGAAIFLGSYEKALQTMQVCDH